MTLDKKLAISTFIVLLVIAAFTFAACDDFLTWATTTTPVNAQNPVITSQLVSVTVIFNASYSLSLAANVSDGGTLSYRWYSTTSVSNSGGTLINGITSSAYSPPTDTAGTYYYFVEITNTIFDNGDGGNKTATIRSNAVIFTVLEEGQLVGAYPAIFIEDFEYADNAAWNDSPWSGSASITITTAAAEAPENADFGNVTRFVKLPTVRVSGGGSTILERRVHPIQASALTFSFRTEIHAPFGQNFRVYVNGVERGSWDGLGMSWRTETILMNAGEQLIRFEVSSTGTAVSGGLNAVYIDNISLVPDSTDSVVLYPRGNLHTYIGASESEKIQFSAQALRSDGSIRKNAAGFAYSGSGVNASTGILTPTTTGNITVSVSLDGKTASRTVTVHPADYLRRPYTYPGTGVTYNGFTTGTAGTLTTNGGVTITYPSQTTFNADGFFTLEGTVNNSAVYNYAIVRLRKNSDNSLETNYFVRDTFKQRIWLRFGPGAYTVTVHGLTSITLSAGLGAEGDLRSWSWSGSGVIFNVTNTRNDGISVDGVTPDRRFIYPSHLVQSDDLRVTNLVADLTYGLTDDVAKIRVLHDYIVTNTVYDQISYQVEGMRKKQDALTVLGTRYPYDTRYLNGHFLAVCEGYANLSAALIRAAGFEVKYVSSTPMGHGWVHVYVDGRWKLLDTTWNDPVPSGANATNVIDMGPAYVRYTYFLLNNLTGVNISHYGDVPRNDRSLIVPAVPYQHGVPDGWY